MDLYKASSGQVPGDGSQAWMAIGFNVREFGKKDLHFMSSLVVDAITIAKRREKVKLASLDMVARMYEIGEERGRCFCLRDTPFCCLIFLPRERRKAGRPSPSERSVRRCLQIDRYPEATQIIIAKD